jgi:hypothetical protein
MRWNIIVECVEEDGKQSTITLGTIERLAGSTTAKNLGVNLQESKQIANRLQDTVVKQQLQEHREQRRKCLSCGRLKTSAADDWIPSWGQRWTPRRADVVHARCALLNGELGQYTRWSPSESSPIQAVAA